MLKGGGCFVFYGIKSNLAECSLNHVVVNKVFDTFDQDGEKNHFWYSQEVTSKHDRQFLYVYLD